MTTIGQSSFLWLDFKKDGSEKSPWPAKLQEAVSQPGVTDLVIISHGWKNDQSAAWALYEELWLNVSAALKTFDPSKIVVGGVEWPSRRYQLPADFKAMEAEAEAADAGGVLASDDAGAGQDIEDFEEQVRGLLEAAEPEDIETFLAAAQAYVQGGAAADVFTTLPAASLNVGADTELKVEQAKLLALASDPETTLQILAAPPTFEVSEGVGGAQGIGDVIGGWLQGRKVAVIRLLEQFSYYEMKQRAGVVGKRLGEIINTLSPPAHIRVHFIGHSFGARVVTAAAKAFDSQNLELVSMSLLQGAYSHNGLSKARDGYFHDVVSKPTGAITISHTHNDKACTLIYALASRLSRDNTKKIGDRNDEFGSMGANGAQFGSNEPDGRAALQFDVSDNFEPQRGRVNNFRADTFIKDRADAHNDVRNVTVGKLVAATLEA